MVFAVTSEGNEPHGQARRSETRHCLPSLGIAPLHNLKQQPSPQKVVSQLPLIVTGRSMAALDHNTVVSNSDDTVTRLPWVIGPFTRFPKDVLNDASAA
jgi:hypothetical protein